MLKYVRFVAIATGVLLAVSLNSARAQNMESAVVKKMVNSQAQMAATDRQKKMLADADELLAKAQQLKTAVDQTRKDELSVDVIRQADEIEKLAKSVKDRMRQ
jgi:competence transcription factor ComK